MKIRDLKNAPERSTQQIVAVLSSAAKRTAKNGSEFLILEFSDNSGSFSTMCFESSNCFSKMTNAKVGSAYRLRVVPEVYQGKPSPKIDDAVLMTEDEMKADIAELSAVSPLDPQLMKNEFFEIVSEISDEKLKATVSFAIEETNGAFFTSTAAVKMHHAYVYGLLEHSLKCARMASALLPLYPFINRDLALAGTLLHDIGKTVEYTQTIVPERSRTGILQGHVVLGYRMVRRAAIKNGLDADLRERLEHIVLSHQGEPEWGAAVRAATPEAVFVSTIDNFDAKMGAVENALREACGSEFVEVGALRTKVLAVPVISANTDK